MVHCKVAHVRGKTFVEPNIVPPFHRHQIPKPLSTKREELMCAEIQSLIIYVRITAFQAPT